MVQAENYYAIDDLDKALLYYTILMDVLEAGDDSKVGYSWLRRAEILSELNRNEEALRFLNMFLKMYKDCDPKYLPWVERASVLRNEVFARLN
jgi:tetratricopeptide (TPR) repeat protein